MKSAASTRHARVLEDMAATACAEESAPAWTWRGWAGGWAGERVRAGGLGRADGGSLGLGRSGREEGEEGSVSRGARRPQPRSSTESSAPPHGP